jgi:hypothetical protein
MKPACQGRRRLDLIGFVSLRNTGRIPIPTRMTIGRKRMNVPLPGSAGSFSNPVLDDRQEARVTGRAVIGVRLI